MGMPVPQQEPAAPRRWTAEEVRALQDDTRHTPRYELIDGELLVSFDTDERGVTNAPIVEHQRAVRLLLRALDDYLGRVGIGETLSSPADLELEPGTIVQPDVFVVPLAGGRGPGAWSELSSILLVIEILSPSTARHDRVTKRRFFQRVGVPEYWIVDADSRVVERWRPGDERPEVLDATLAWHPEGAAAPLVLDLAAFFARVHREG